MRKWLVLTAALGLASSAAAGPLTAAGAENRLIVAFQPGMAAAAQKSVVESYGLKMIDAIPELNVVLVEAQPGLAAHALSSLAARPDVKMVGRDIWRNWIDAGPASFQETPLPSVDSVLKQLPLEALRTPRRSDSEVPWGVAKVNAPAVWDRNQGSGVKVAVIDTGIAADHPELKVSGGYNAVDKNAPWADDHSHGSHVAGTIAAAFDGKGVVGIAPKAELYAVKVLTKEGQGGLFSIMDGIMWTAQNGINVANMSLGAPQEMPFLQYALQYAKSAGVTFVAAAGNDGKAVNWPAKYPECIAVAALCPPGITNQKACPTTNEGIATFSSRGPEIAFIAPGVKVRSTVLRSGEFGDASGYKEYSGTSMATPHVTGLAALAVAAGAKDPDSVRAALQRAATPMSGMSSEEQGNGLIDAAKLVR